MSDGFLFTAFVYLAAAVLAVPLAKRLGLGSVLGYLIAGVAVGPYGFGFLGTEGQDLLHFAEFGVVMMLFVIGLELEPALLWRLRGVLLGMGGLQVTGTAVAVTAIALFLGQPWPAAVAIGLILSLSSTAIVLQSLAEKNLLKTDAGQRSFAVLLFQDLAVIPMLAVLPLLAARVPHGAGGGTGAGHGASGAAVEGAAGHGAGMMGGLPPALQTVAVLAAVAAVILGGRFVVRPAFRVLARTRLREMFTAASLLLVIGIALLMTVVGLSPALGTFLAGVVLANSEYRHELESDLEPFKGLLLGLFFVAVGASIDFGLVTRNAGTTALLVAGLMAVKFAVLFALGRGYRMGLDQNLLFAAALAQGGEFCFVLLSFAGQQALLDAATANLLVATVALSMALTPVALVLWERAVRPRLGTREAAAREPDAIDEDAPVIVAGFGRFGSVVGRLMTANGFRTTVLDHDSDQVDVLRRLGFKVFYGDASRVDLLHAAGVERARLVIVATDDAEKTRQIVGTVRHHWPHVRVLARARGRSEAYELLDQGLERVYRETLDTSLRLGEDALRALGVPAYVAHRAAQRFRRRDEESLAALARVRHDQAAYMGEARRRIRDLEETLREDVEREHASDDRAWDSSSLVREYGRPPAPRTGPRAPSPAPAPSPPRIRPRHRGSWAGPGGPSGPICRRIDFGSGPGRP